MKAIMVSIRPQHLANILNGKKTIEIRKSKLPLNVPVYLYCTKGKPTIVDAYSGVLENEKPSYCDINDLPPIVGKVLNGKVVAKCIFSEVDNYDKINRDWAYLIPEEDLKKTCLLYEEIEAYGNSKPLYFYHITDLEIFEEPMELSEFDKPMELKEFFRTNYVDDDGYFQRLKKAPKSWQYVYVNVLHYVKKSYVKE